MSTPSGTILTVCLALCLAAGAAFAKGPSLGKPVAIRPI
jgi:hypothetical protein